MFNLGGMEILVILVVALLVLGPDKLPNFMRVIGKAVGELRRASTEFQRTINTEIGADDLLPSTPKPAEPVPAPSTIPAQTSPSGEAGAAVPENPAAPEGPVAAPSETEVFSAEPSLVEPSAVELSVIEPPDTEPSIVDLSGTGRSAPQPSGRRALPRAPRARRLRSRNGKGPENA